MPLGGQPVIADAELLRTRPGSAADRLCRHARPYGVLLHRESPVGGQSTVRGGAVGAPVGRREPAAEYAGLLRVQRQARSTVTACADQ
ncbi:hypothetical protein GCM10018773_59930 [Streptomyces candidus]|nr:hypothetical protein GCM10018773_59930 [Streptomyces candidus]